MAYPTLFVVVSVTYKLTSDLPSSSHILTESFLSDNNHRTRALQSTEVVN